MITRGGSDRREFRLVELIDSSESVTYDPAGSAGTADLQSHRTLIDAGDYATNGPQPKPRLVRRYSTRRIVIGSDFTDSSKWMM